MSGEESRVWVEEYTTSTGVHVSGHWRTLRPGTGESGTTLTADAPVVPLQSTGRLDQAPAAARCDAAAAEVIEEPRVQAGLEALRRRRAVLAQSNEQTERCPDCGQFYAADHECTHGLEQEHAGPHVPGAREVRAVREVDGAMEWCEDHEADCFTLYEADEDGFMVALDDHDTRDQAEAGLYPEPGEKVTVPEAVSARIVATEDHVDVPAGSCVEVLDADPELHRVRAAYAGHEVQLDVDDVARTHRQRCDRCGQYTGAGEHSCPTPAGLPAGDYAGMKGEERVQVMLADLEASVKAIVESGQLDLWLDAMASNGLNRWSANNRLLAMVQMWQRGGDINGLHLMGFRQWEKHNRNVSKGAKAVWILAPITRKKIEEDENGNERVSVFVSGFKSVPVFDISDTQGEPLPAAPIKAAPGEATPGTLEGLRDRVGAAGYAYEESEIPGCRPATGEGTLGYTDPKTKRIVVDSRLSEAQKASTIAHELGHVHCGHVDRAYGDYLQHRGRMETEAEAVAYLTMRAKGMTREQADAFSPGYIASWSRGDAKVMHGAMETAVKAFNKIIDGDWPTGGTQ